MSVSQLSDMRTVGELIIHLGQFVPSALVAYTWEGVFTSVNLSKIKSKEESGKMFVILDAE